MECGGKNGGEGFKKKPGSIEPKHIAHVCIHK